MPSPWMLSAPSPPSIVSASPRPTTVSLPARAVMVSFCGVPISTSLPSVPLMGAANATVAATTTIATVSVASSAFLRCKTPSPVQGRVAPISVQRPYRGVVHRSSLGCPAVPNRAPIQGKSKHTRAHGTRPFALRGKRARLAVWFPETTKGAVPGALRRIHGALPLLPAAADLLAVLRDLVDLVRGDLVLAGAALDAVPYAVAGENH